MHPDHEPSTFRRCSTCKRPIAFEARYWVCSVSTCNRKKLGLFFCSVACWDAHLPDARHRDAWAEERRAPTRAAWEAARATGSDDAPEGSDDGAARPPRPAVAAPTPPTDAPARRVVAAPTAALPLDEPDGPLPHDVLIVVSKLKAYIKARSGMNTSDGVTEVLSDHLRRLCHEAIRNAARDERRTVMDRDFAPLVK